MKQHFFKPLLALTLITVFFSCKQEVEKTLTEKDITLESKKVTDFFQKTFDTRVDNHPEFQTRLGIKKDYGKLEDISPEASEKELKFNQEILQWLNDSVNVEALSKDVLLSYKLFKQKAENHISNYEYRLHNYPVNQMFGAQSGKPAFLINMHRIDSLQDAEAYISRLKGFKPYFNQLIENLKAREAIGIMPPTFVYDKVIQDSENIIVGEPFDQSQTKSALLDDFLNKINKLDLDDATKKDLEAQANEALLTGVKPAYDDLIAFMSSQKERSNTDAGAWKFPNGDAFYKNALANTTTTDLTANEIHEIGLSEVARIHKEMDAIRVKVGFDGDLQDFFEFMKTDKQFYYSSDEKGKAAYLKEAVHLIDSMKTRLDEIFITKPKADIIVKAVEPFREQSAGKAFYNRPAADGSRPGIYYANLYDMASMPTYQMEALAYHEGIPGHHMQLAIQQELENVPMFRKFGGYTAYTEGWGLYSEFIPKEMGFYADPYSDFGRLAMELWRACRLVVDTGIHAKKWTREEGIKYYTDNTPNAELDGIKMVERHIVMPSQATAYKIGMLKILELRKKAQEALGEQFDIREFHEVVISHGAIPLNVLEDFVDEYISSKQNKIE
ncbi:DUF885 domain-containing protein [Tamlana sp. 2_MG-2023]|uniref:DUF885 domain-containing protein n=1 Tax=unclassified Tamlana TaxID=2614803 RepID=UPI0026E33E02|nr:MULTISPECIES: DUF885 domain-containing protein [unclassified Tamlana]MDO6759264.1 DUF885 domain-containing protein [Tamlana sp. 2_MG-2023]MDO6790597.1 DUF885 domain-containing protein [Tamlana sp. 1_MG-2023]